MHTDRRRIGEDVDGRGRRDGLLLSCKEHIDRLQRLIDPPAQCKANERGLETREERKNPRNVLHFLESVFTDDFELSFQAWSDEREGLQLRVELRLNLVHVFQGGVDREDEGGVRLEVRPKLRRQLCVAIPSVSSERAIRADSPGGVCAIRLVISSSLLRSIRVAQGSSQRTTISICILHFAFCLSPLAATGEGRRARMEMEDKESTITLVASYALGTHLEASLYYNSASWHELLRQAIDSLLAAFATAHALPRSSTSLDVELSPFQLFKRIWFSEGWGNLHKYGAGDARGRPVWMDSIYKGFLRQYSVLSSAGDRLLTP